jgi:hypothetical protein
MVVHNGTDHLKQKRLTQWANDWDLYDPETLKHISPSSLQRSES